MNKSNLEVEIAGIKLKNPIMPASGTFGIETCELINCNNLGALLPKSFTLNPQDGNKPPRVVETVGGMLNSVGIQNKGIKYFIKTTLPLLSKYNSPVIASISAYTIDDFEKMLKMLNDTNVSMVELNISCPNLKEGGQAFGMDAEDTYKIVKAAKNISTKPIITKLTPNVNDIVTIALAAESAGSDSISLINTLIGMAIDVDTMKPKLGNIIGGLSGPAIKPIALRMVWQVAQKVNIPVIGIGGITSGRDAIEFILAGATAVQIGTSNFTNPKIMDNIITEINDYLIHKNIKDINLIRGKLNCNI